MKTKRKKQAVIFGLFITASESSPFKFPLCFDVDVTPALRAVRMMDAVPRFINELKVCFILTLKLYFEFAFWLRSHTFRWRHHFAMTAQEVKFGAFVFLCMCEFAVCDCLPQSLTVEEMIPHFFSPPKLQNRGFFLRSGTSFKIREIPGKSGRVDSYATPLHVYGQAPKAPS